jgi:SAM-dependent MidA family methyltransferase
MTPSSSGRKPSNEMLLQEIIIEKISTEGPISFRDYMEMALYYPGLGYYTKGNNQIGTGGDYYTSPYLTPLFGEMIAKQLEEMWYILGKKAFTIVEYGAGAGLLCRHLMQSIKKKQEWYDQLTYYVIEKNAENGFSELYPDSEKLYRVASIQDLPAITGCILSNELVDNFPVHRVLMQDQLMEVFVNYRDGFEEILRPASGELCSFIQEFYPVFPKGFRTEINLDALTWIRETANKLHRGFLLTFDYGYQSSGGFPSQGNGTLVCYHKHQVNGNPYLYIGDQDITADVNFSALQKWGINYGLKTCGFTSQSNFLSALGLTNHIRETEKQVKGLETTDDQKKRFASIFLFEMGKKIKVLIQQNGLIQPQISGLLFGGRSI